MDSIICECWFAPYFDNFNASDHTRCISLNNQTGKTRPVLIVLNSVEYNEGLHYYPFRVNSDRSNGDYNSLDDPSGSRCVPNKTGDTNVCVFKCDNKNEWIKNINKTYIMWM